MRLTLDSDALPRRRGRRILIALLILLLILLPLYLWPFRGGITGLPGAAALSRLPLDPRNAGELARIPGEVWDALMGRTAEPPSARPPKPPRNLTMIATIEEVAGSGPLDVVLLPRDPRLLSALGDESPAFESKPGGDGSSPAQLVASSSGEQGTGNRWDGFGSGGYPGLSNLGPWGGGGPGGRGRGAPLLISSGPTWNPGDPGSPAPTPEPATILLVGSNLALLGALAWKRRRRREETPS